MVILTMIANLNFNELRSPLPATKKMQQLVQQIQQLLGCNAVGLLKKDGEQLKPIALTGLVHTTYGRRFNINEHPRLQALVSQSSFIHFPPDTPLPDPYDGLLQGYQGQPLPVHDCMGASLWCDQQCWGILTLDSLEQGHFSQEHIAMLPGLIAYIESILKIASLEGEVKMLRSAMQNSQLKIKPSAPTNELIGQHPKIKSLLNEIDVVANSDLPVLLRGETGVGKELFAWRLHQKSARNDQPMIHVNCAALPETLAESELFGHVKGAFSGALSERQGRFDAANPGTLFLDEIGELPLRVQAKLLRTLQNGEIQRLGSDHILKVDVRVIAATNRDLEQMVKQGQFRADLYHRLSVYPVLIPPLRERGQDILLLAGYFIELNRSRFSFRSLRLSPAAEQALLSYSWPGNIRELEHVISRATLRTVSRGANKKEIVTIEDYHLDIDLLPNPPFIPDTPQQTSTASAMLPFHEKVKEFQRQLIEQALNSSQNNWAEAARILKIDSSNLHKMASRLGLKQTDKQ